MKSRTRTNFGLFGLIVILLTLLAGWQAHKLVQDHRLPFRTIDQGQGGLGYSTEQPGLMIFVRPGELETSGLDANNTVRLRGRLPTVDYQREFIVVAFQGSKGSGGFDISVQRIWQIGNQVYLQAKFVEPRPDSSVTLGFTSPYHLVTISNTGTSGQTIRFILLRGTVVVAEATRFIP